MSDLATAPSPTGEAKEGTPSSQGKFFWYELMTTDQAAADAFYKAVVGWNMADAGQSNMRYTILSAGERGVGGVLQLTDKMLSGGARAGWVGYINVPDADAAAKGIALAGGTVLMGPDDIPDVGRFAMVADPGGAVFYVMNPRPPEGAKVLPPADPTTPGLFSWHELFSSLGDKAAFDFYAGRFGWETLNEMDMGPMGTYRIFGKDGVQLGGMMNKPDNIPVSVWRFYINVEGIDAAAERVKANNGQVLMAPHEVPGGSWIVQCLDPQGASFALLSASR